MHTRLSPHIVRLDEITAAHEAGAGAKAFNCARLRQGGFSVPDGLVVLAGATEDERRALAAHPWLDELPDDVRLAVRSSGIGEDSAGQSFAGIHQTLLDVERGDIVRAVTECLASAHSNQALEYRRAAGAATDAIRMGVLIQRMVRPVASGVAFTVNPVTGAEDEVVINASWGVGEALVNGQIDPDELVVGKRDGEIRWSRIGEKGGADRPGRCLTADQVRELTAILHRIERFYEAPQDVEWCYAGGAFWIVQSRPVTAVAERPDETEWTRANIGEVMPDITSPQVLAVFEDLLNRAERQHLGRLMAPEDAVGPMVKSFHGRLYFNLSQMRHVCRLGAVVPAALLRSMGHPEAIDERDERVSPAPLGERLACIPDFARIVWRHVRAPRVIREHDARTQELLDRLTVPNRRDLPDADVWAVIERWCAEAPDYMQVVLLLGNVLFHEAPIQKACARVGFSYERLVYPLLAGGERSVSAQQAFDLTALARAARREPRVLQFLAGEPGHISHVRFALRGTAFLAEFERFLAKYGHRGRYEYRLVAAALRRGSDGTSTGAARARRRRARRRFIRARSARAAGGRRLGCVRRAPDAVAAPDHRTRRPPRHTQDQAVLRVARARAFGRRPRPHRAARLASGAGRPFRGAGLARPAGRLLQPRVRRDRRRARRPARVPAGCAASPRSVRPRSSGGPATACRC